MYPLIVSARNDRCHALCDYLRIFVNVRCKCLDKIELTDVLDLDVSCLIFAQEKDHGEFHEKFHESGGKFPPLILPDSTPATKVSFSGRSIPRHGLQRRILKLIKQHPHVEPPPEEMAANIFVFIFRYPYQIGNVNSITGCLSKQEYRRVREVFRNQFGLSMRKWLTIKKIMAILGMMHSREESGQYASLAWECGFRSHAAFGTFLRMHFGKNIRSLEEEAKGLEEKELMEKIHSFGILL